MNAKKSGFQLIPFATSVAITLIIGFVASLFTRPQISGWYAALQKPLFNPPAWVFAPVWTVLYILMATAAYLVWKRRNGTRTYYFTAALYLIQLALNFSWSIVFFGQHQIFGAMVIIAFLAVTILFNIVWFSKFSKAAAWLLAPYLLWVGFAALLNFNIFLLNN